MPLERTCKPVRLHYHHYVPDNCNYDLAPILFVHGISSNHRAWNKVLSRISNQTGREAYAIDMRNHGRSEWTDDFRLEDLVADVENFLSERNLKSVVMVGHSLGGRIAMHIALHKPELVSKIVVEDMKIAEPSQEEISIFVKVAKLAKTVSLLPKDANEKEIRVILARRLKYVMPEIPQAELESFFLLLTRDKEGKFCFDFNVEALRKSALDGSMYRLNINTYQSFSEPTLFIYAAKSPTEVGKDKSIPKHFPNVLLHEMDCNNHVLHNDFPHEFAEKVSDFINI